MFNTEKLIYQLGKVPYATVYNFQPWTAVNKESTLKYSLQYPDKLFKGLRERKIINKVPVYPAGEMERDYRKSTFYTIKASTKAGNVSQSQLYRGQIAFDLLRHQSGLMDIFLAFVNLYPDYTIEIDYTKELSYKKLIKRNGRSEMVNAKYCPDGFIKLTSPEMKEYHFFIEFERTKTNEQIRDKFKMCNALNKFGTYGLSRHTKFLFVYTYELYNVYARPIEYGNHEIMKYQKAAEGRLERLIDDSQEYLNDSFRFLPFDKFNLLNQAEWINYRKQKISIVS